MATKQYRIICLQGAALPSWEGKFTESELREKFWDYAQDEELYEAAYDGEPIPDWFDLAEIAGVWDVRLEEVE